MPIALVTLEGALEPLRRFLGGARLRIELHHLWMAEHFLQEIEVVVSHPAELKTGGGDDGIGGTRGCRVGGIDRHVPRLSLFDFVHVDGVLAELVECGKLKG